MIDYKSAETEHHDPPGTLPSSTSRQTLSRTKQVRNSVSALFYSIKIFNIIAINFFLSTCFILDLPSNSLITFLLYQNTDKLFPIEHLITLHIFEAHTQFLVSVVWNSCFRVSDYTCVRTHAFSTCVKDTLIAAAARTTSLSTEILRAYCLRRIAFSESTTFFSCCFSVDSDQFSCNSLLPILQ